MLARPAATVLLVRDGGDGIEVLMLERRLESGFVPGAWVFPGGGLDPVDHDPAAHTVTDGPADRRDGLAHRLAAVRETFEEAGVLLARHRTGQSPEPALVARLQPDRHRLEVGEISVTDLCTRHDLVLQTAALRPFAHWVTPEGPPRRYDTRFFVAPAPDGQPASPCGREATAAHWVGPADVLARAAAGALPLILPTERCLHAIAGFPTVDHLLSATDEALARADSSWVHDRGGTRLDLAPAEPSTREGSAA